jgi:hypothetical protein
MKLMLLNQNNYIKKKEDKGKRRKKIRRARGSPRDARRSLGDASPLISFLGCASPPIS